jgi:hypothetical protein
VSGDLVAYGASRDLRAVSTRMERAGAECEAGDTRKARLMLRAAERRAQLARTVMRNGDAAYPAWATALTSEALDELVKELRSLRRGMSCP